MEPSEEFRTANVIIILVFANEKLVEMSNFGVLFVFALFGNNQHYVKYYFPNRIHNLYTPHS